MKQKFPTTAQPKPDRSPSAARVLATACPVHSSQLGGTDLGRLPTVMCLH